MNKIKILQEVNKIFNEVLDEEVILNFDTSAKDIVEWDSLTHIQLVVQIEKYFKHRFTALEIQSWRNVGEMCESIETKKLN